MSRRVVIYIENADIDTFRSRLLEVEYIKRLYKAGKAFERGVFSEAEFGKRLFEGYKGDIDILGVEELLKLL
jgi:hypothetical protein